MEAMIIMDQDIQRASMGSLPLIKVILALLTKLSFNRISKIMKKFMGNKAITIITFRSLKVQMEILSQTVPCQTRLTTNQLIIN